MKILIFILLIFVAIELWFIDAGIKVLNSNIVELIHFFNPNDEVHTIETLEDWKVFKQKQKDSGIPYSAMK